MKLKSFIAMFMAFAMLLALCACGAQESAEPVQAETAQQAEQLIKPVAHYAKNSPSRVPFGDWYQANEGTNCMFIARSVQGGIFMPMLLH